MSSIIPITLHGSNLGERHSYLNSLVGEAFTQQLPLEQIVELPESSSADRLFKIDLAIKHKNVDYIIKNWKDDDMLFVSRALKSLWLLDSEHKGIINPPYLESEVYPYMTATAVNKTKHWIHLHLCDSQRCEDFYQYYKTDFTFAVKFLTRCSAEFILTEFLSIMDKVTAKHLKILCERSPQISKLYFDNLSKNQTALSRYLEDEKKYYDSFKSLMKLDANLYLDITEKYFNLSKFSPLGSDATLYIMKNHKQRFENKPELYAARLLDMKTLAKYLNTEEIKDLVLKLARAEFLNYWFSYKSVEPLIKRLSVEERSVFKKQVFVEKSIGMKIKDWPYSVPCGTFKLEDLSHIFVDVEHQPYEYEVVATGRFKRKVMKRCLRTKREHHMFSECCQSKSLLDQLFDRYRFYSFERTLFELRKQLSAESSMQNREYMLLVLVSKSGGNLPHLETLLHFLVEAHRNEPSNLRAAILRSLVVRACVWRLPSEPWTLLLNFGRELGLDGISPVLCREGMHASVLRVLLSGDECPKHLSDAYLKAFSVFTDYKLNSIERRIVKERLPTLMLTAATENSTIEIDRYHLFLDTLMKLKVSIDNYPEAIKALVAAVRSDPIFAENLVIRLFNERIARRELFRENFALFKNNFSYLNALRHDVSVLQDINGFVDLLNKCSPHLSGFLRKLAVYFSEPNGLKVAYVAAITRAIASEPNPSLAKPLALLGGEVDSILIECAKEPKGSARRKLAAALLANCHITRLVDIESIDWRTIGAKAIANGILTCRSRDVEKYVEKLLEWRRTFRLALILAERGVNLKRVYATLVAKRPSSAVRGAVLYYRRRQHCENVDKTVWCEASRALSLIDLSLESRRFLRHMLEEADFIPSDIRAAYWSDVYQAFKRISKAKSMPILCRLENILPEVDNSIIQNAIEEFLNEFTLEYASDNSYILKMIDCMRVRIVAKHVLLCKNSSEQDTRLSTVLTPFFERLESLLKESEQAMTFLQEFVYTLKYNKAFLDPNVISCSPILEWIVTRIRKMLPVEVYFDIYVTLHLVMLYYNSVKESVKLHSNIFDDSRSKRDKATVVVGILFGKCIGHEVRELVKQYFKSVLVPYQKYLMTFLREHIKYNANRGQFITAIMQGLLEVGNTETLLIAEHVFQEEHSWSSNDPERKDILEKLKSAQDQETKMFIYADLYSGPMS